MTGADCPSPSPSRSPSPTPTRRGSAILDVCIPTHRLCGIAILRASTASLKHGSPR